MYRIASVNTGSEIGVVDDVIYIRVGDSGNYTGATKDTATGVSVDSVAYDLIGHDEVNGADTVVVTEFNGGATIAEQQRIINGLLITMLEG